MLFARHLHPDFGYFCPSASLRRKLRLGLAATVFGLIAGASGVGMLMTDHDPTSQGEWTLAGMQAPNRDTSAMAAGVTRPADLAQEPVKVEEVKRSCQGNSWDHLEGNCTSGPHKPRSIRSATDRPAIAAVPIGHLDGLTESVLSRAMPVESTPPADEAFAKAADPVPSITAPEPSRPAVTAKKPRKKAHSHARRRGQDQYWSWRNYGYPYHRGGYARQGSWTVFW